ncbi:hypothetical protein F4777DRAFT_576031 [Nemania sp. FL0916]|nr:hypothetical protein F4777DRAFT_576031 [Nemania sp. FL0916]
MSGEDEQVARPSRYRSLRNPAATARRSTGGTDRDNNPELGQPQENSVANSISRSMSRYRRRATSVTGDIDNDAALAVNSDLNNAPPVPAIPPLLKTAGPPTVPGGLTELKSPTRHQLCHVDAPNTATSQSPSVRDTPSITAHDSRRERSAMAGQETQHRPPEPQRDANWEAERDRLLEEQKRKDLLRLEEELENSRKAKAQGPKLRSPVVEKFALIAKGTKGSKDSKDMAPASTAITPAKSGTQRPGHEAKTPPATHIEPGGKGIVPQKDAPASASNAGDRNVTVRWRHNTLNLAVTPDTIAADLIAQTAQKLPWDLEIIPEKCLLIEQYTILGLERRLRRYERIRDVMDSWDIDAPNQLAVTLSESDDNNDDLEVSAVADCKKSTTGCQVHLYHSNRPGKWNKRWITLLESGQIICAKKPNAKTADKEATSLCHLSDYDLYSLSESQMRRHLKPPKKFCFAIKSQHKTTLFLNTENYVQYFSTEDPQVASEFKQKAHTWRSCYLVDRRPEIRQKPGNSVVKTEETTPPQSPPTKHGASNSDNVASVNGHRLRVSVDESPYAIGKFEPLLDMTRFDKRLSQFGKDFLPPEPDTSKQAADQTARRRLSKRVKPEHAPIPEAPKQESEEGFTGGLLAEEYDSRKQALAGLEKKKRPQALVLTEGLPLPNSQQDDTELKTDKPESPSWFPSAIEHTARQRATSQAAATKPATPTRIGGERRFSPNAGTTRQAPRPSTQHASRHPHSHPQAQHHPNPHKSQLAGPPNSDRRLYHKPLVDLTPTTPEAPQWSKDKRGRGVKPPDGLGHLINFISVGDGADGKPGAGHPGLSSHGTVRRPATSGAASMGRSRSMSSATSRGRPLLDDIPPVPVLPARLGLDGDGKGKRLASAPIARDNNNNNRPDRRDTVKHGERDHDKTKTRERDREREQRDREYREREAAYNAVPGRTGTLKVV